MNRFAKKIIIMKRILLVLSFFILCMNSFSQEKNDSISVNKAKTNRWSIDFAFGSSRGIKPYNDGYFSSENDKVLGELNLNSVGIGARFYMNKSVTFKSDLTFDRFTPNNVKSINFDVAQFRLSIQTMFNLNTVFGINHTSRFNLPIHLGVNIASLKTIKSSENQVIGSPDYILGVIYGFAPMYNVSKNVALFVDLSLINNFRQHHTWDGNISDEKNNLNGQMSAISLGLNFKLGKKIQN
ncbi:hypothetical protein [Flavobacterium aquatile]|uniref:Outer membrane protein beta-barrel domain-containing protein n=1 Tax=Flavobacterium aquatile LMG 4008 = ATCC 11947 TaxID=1453498 RepID=A0A095SSK5_9FLAO|nr:hypothetical protein [Flavobacterium aquatile]KGD67591.1 hypothetical protein LG45_10675 [Flavobacterium aquatile LMG 4008 = ATCC 11947]OXA67451.1 hypothetical protein B0A61_06415 [Flavobacterium aquatile LMG 4008 = ATCC 11947]GEC79222.1 hypothetical protein FAQ01_20920 [Flavobacterium aquatile]